MSVSKDCADKWVFRVFAACFAASLFTGCASTFENGSAYGDVFNQVRSKSYDAPLNLQGGTRTVRLWPLTPEEVKNICGGRNVMACAIPQADGSWAVAIAPPKSWNDHISLATLGHELAHVWGGKHE